MVCYGGNPAATPSMPLSFDRHEPGLACRLVRLAAGLTQPLDACPGRGNKCQPWCYAQHALPRSHHGSWAHMHQGWPLLQPWPRQNMLLVLYSSGAAQLTAAPQHGPSLGTSNGAPKLSPCAIKLIDTCITDQHSTTRTHHSRFPAATQCT